MLARLADFDEFVPLAHHIDNGGIFVELGAELVEIGDFQLGTLLHRARVRLQFTENQLQQRSFAGAVRPQQANTIAALDTSGKIANDDFAAVGLGNVLQLRYQLAGALATVNVELYLALLFAPRGAILAQLLQPADAAFTAGAARFDPLANPDFFLRLQAVGLALYHRLHLQHFRFARLVSGEIAGKADQHAPIQFDNTSGDIVQKAPVVRDDHHRSGKALQQLFQPFDRCYVEVIGRLVQQHQIGFGHQRTRQCHALFPATGKAVDRRVRSQVQMAQHRLDQTVEAPAVEALQFILQFVHAAKQRLDIGICSPHPGTDLVVIEQQPAQFAQTLGYRLEYALAGRELRLLRHVGQTQILDAYDLAVIQMANAGHRLQ